MTERLDNPFRITKSNDLTDEQIDQLWVPAGEDEEAIVRPASPMAMFILGGKGSGKSHLMRYYSFPLQLIRYKRTGENLIDNLRQDGYVGIYARCGGLNSHRFHGKGQSDEVWDSLFAYYFELWVADRLLWAIEVITQIGSLGSEVDKSIAADIAELFDSKVAAFQSIEAAKQYFTGLRQTLDYSINNAALTSRLDAEIMLSRGRLFFGIPSIVCARVPALQNVLFVYLLDEFENFTLAQQIYVNTLIREREGPTAFKVGSRLYGFRTQATLSGGERNLEGSEYEKLELDERFRTNDKAYRTFAMKLIALRLSASFGSVRSTDSSLQHLSDFFQEPDLDWNSNFLTKLFSSGVAVDRPHLNNLREKLNRGLKDKVVGGPRAESDVQEILTAVTFPDYPVLEKICILHIYQKWFRSADILKAAHYVRDKALAFIQGTHDGQFDEFVSKYKSDMVAQLLRENAQKQLYAGLPEFIRMSEGLPRTLITILKHIYDWSIYLREEPFRSGKISIRAQQRGVTEAAEWFLDQMLMEGEDGVRVRSAVERLAQLFRTNRFADKPVETSLVAFSVDESQMSKEARRILSLAKNTSLIINVPRGQRERNSEQVTSKLELNLMLAPRWDLPTGRRGVTSFTPFEANSVFDHDDRTGFETLLKNWELKMTAPLFGRSRTLSSGRPPQPDLFE